MDRETHPTDFFWRDFVQFVEFGHSWAIECVGLFLVPFLHEDIAIIGGGMMIVDHYLPVPLALASLYGGMVVSDFCLFGFGALARRSQWVQGTLLRPSVGRLSFWLSSHLTRTVVLARFVPGLMFPVYVSCGLFGASFSRFALTTATTASVYLSIGLFVVIRFGEAALSSPGYWYWIMAVIVLAVIAITLARASKWQLLLSLSTSSTRELLIHAKQVCEAAGAATHRGMPALGHLPTEVALAERIPPLLFYVPLGLQWLWLSVQNKCLSLPTLANPKIELGGLWGESKSSYLAMVGLAERHWLADYTTIMRSHGDGALNRDLHQALDAITETGLSFPIVAKPDIGWRGFGVRLINSEDELSAYIGVFPENQKIILQKYIDYEGEAGVLYARLPKSPSGTILSLTLRYFPYVIGDGQRCIRDLILADQRSAWKAEYHLGFDAEHVGFAGSALERVPWQGETVRLSFIGSNRVGGLYRDAREHITPRLTQCFDAIAKSIPEFYYGRFDVRFKSLKRFNQAEDFNIIEINGAGGESINVWDPKMALRQVYQELFEQQRLLFKIGTQNRARGFQPSGSLALFKSQWRQHRLILQYPPSS